MRRKISPTACRPTSTLDTRRIGGISLNTSGRNEPMKLRSDFSEALTKLHRLHRESGEKRLAPIPFWQYQKWHPSSSPSSTSWWQWNDSWWSSIQKKSSTSELVKEQRVERRDPLCSFFTKLLRSDTVLAQAVLDQVVFRCVRIVLFGTWLRNFSPFFSRARLCDEQCLRSPTALIMSPT